MYITFQIYAYIIKNNYEGGDAIKLNYLSSNILNRVYIEKIILKGLYTIEKLNNHT